MKSFNKMMNKGFTLIELVMVMVLLGILVAVAIPKYENLTTAAETAAKAATSGAVRSAFAGYLAAHSGTAPTVTQLAAELTGTACTAVVTGISCTLKDGTVYIATTFTDSACSVATTAVTQTVACIGG
ncbi:MAG: type II secretion system protein [Gammaproteobacteria bacterium]